MKTIGLPGDSLQALDAVMSGYAYENATVAIGVIEKGRNTKRWISTEMLCTLDNFVKVVLFSERVFLTGCADLNDNRFVPRKAKYGADDVGRGLFDEAAIFLPQAPSKGDASAVEERVTKTLHPVNLPEYPLFIITCEFPTKRMTIRQEMVYLDAYFIEYAIEQYGAARFKPVPPGEHLYLGLRRNRVGLPQATHTMADVAGRRLRTVVRERMEKLNVFVTQGAPMLPALPPVYVSRILHDSASGSGFVQTLLWVRTSPAMTSFRKWMVKCWELSLSTDMAARQKAADAFAKLNQFSPQDDLSGTDFGISLLKIAKDVASLDAVGIATEIASPIVKYLAGIPFAGLRKFGGRNADPERLRDFFKDNFGDAFNFSELDYISTLLQLPDNLTDWEKEEAIFTAHGGRLDSAAPALARPCFIQVKDAAYVNNALKDIDDLIKRSWWQNLFARS